MDIMSVAGIIAAVCLLIYGVSHGGNVSDFIISGPAAITFGGTAAALMIAFPPRVFAELPKLFIKIFFPRLGYDCSPQKYIRAIEEISGEVKKYGILYLDEKLPGYKDGFIKKCLQLAVDSEGPEAVRAAMEKELGHMAERHRAGIAFFEKGAVFAIGFGIIGTLSGLIELFSAAETPDLIAGGMAGALITAFYGLILGNVIFLPMGNKLKKRSDEEILCKQLVIEGVILIINDAAPSQIREKLILYVPPYMIKKEKSKINVN